MALPASLGMRQPQLGLHQLRRCGAMPGLLVVHCATRADVVAPAPALQATRQSMLKKYGAIRHAMDRLHNSRLSNYEQVETLDEIRRCRCWVEQGGLGSTDAG